VGYAVIVWRCINLETVHSVQRRPANDVKAISNVKMVEKHGDAGRRKSSGGDASDAWTGKPSDERQSGRPLTAFTLIDVCRPVACGDVQLTDRRCTYSSVAPSRSLTRDAVLATH